MPPESTIAEPISTSTSNSFADQFDAPVGAASEDDYVDPATVDPGKSETEPLKAKAAEKPPEKAAEKTAAKAAQDANPNLEEPPVAKVEKEAAKATDDEVPKGMTAKAVETWKIIKHDRDEARAERDTIKAESAALKKQLEDAGKSAPELETIRKELADAKAQLTAYEDEIAISRVESTAQFKTQVTAQQKASEEAAGALATKYEVEAGALLAAIREPDADKRADLIEEVSADFKFADKTRLTNAANAYETAQKVAAEMRTNAGAKLEELTKAQQQDAERIATANIADYRKAAGEAWKALQEHHPIIRPVDGKQDWNDFLAAEAREIEAIDVNNLPVSEVAKAKAAERALPQIAKAVVFYQTQNKDLREKLLAAEERLGEYRKTEPGAGAGKTAADKAGENGSGSFFDKVFEEER